MRFPRTLSFQVALEIIAYSSLSFIAITIVLVSQNLVRRLDDLTMVGLTAVDFAIVLRSLLPMLTSYATPVAFLFGALLAMRRMSSDREILAMRSCGLGLTALLAPTLCLGVLASLLSGYLMISVEHQARRNMLGVFKSVATRGGILEPGKFRLIGPRMFYIESRDRENQLEGIMIIDHSNRARPIRIFAERGQLHFDDELDTIRLSLENGDLHLRPPPGDPGFDRKLSFDRFEYSFDVSALLGEAFSPTRPRQMTLDELHAVMDRATSGDPLIGLDQRDPMEYALEIERRFALPLAPVLFALLVVPLGLRSSAGGRSLGVLLCLILVFSYYALMALGQFIARAGLANATLALWLPNVLFGIVAIALLWRDGRSVPR